MDGFQKVTDRQILMTIKALGPTRMSAIADQLGITRQAIFYRLRRLEILKRVKRERGNRTSSEPDIWSLYPRTGTRLQPKV